MDQLDPKKIAVYFRVSTRKQDFDSQKHEIDLWLEKNHQTNTDACSVFLDHAMSGANDKRPGLAALIAAAEAKQITLLVVYRLDRLSRRANTAIATLLRLDELGVAFVSTSQAVLNLGPKNPFRRTLLAAFSEIAELERDATITRIKSGLAAAKKRGTKLGAPQRIDEEQRVAVLAARTSGRTMRSIAEDLGISLGSVAKIIRDCVIPTL